MESFVSVILLFGGTGSRMGSSTPKQYLKLKKKIIALYSFDFFLKLPEISEIIIVCEPEYRHLFTSDINKKTIKFAMPGALRQDSVFNALKTTSEKADLICIHDGARPFLKEKEVKQALNEADKIGAATLGSKAINTLKKVKDNFVEKTLKRADIYEIYTPQIIKKDILIKGFKFAHDQNIEVTDDVSLAELIKQPVKIIESEKNIKITTPVDLKIAETYI